MTVPLRVAGFELSYALLQVKDMSVVLRVVGALEVTSVTSEDLKVRHRVTLHVYCYKVALCVGNCWSALCD